MQSQRDILISQIKMTGRELRGLMRKHRVTIRELSKRTGIFQYRIRQVRSNGLVGLAVLDWQEAIIGELPARLRAALHVIQSSDSAGVV